MASSYPREWTQARNVGPIRVEATFIEDGYTYTVTVDDTPQRIIEWLDDLQRSGQLIGFKQIGG